MIKVALGALAALAIVGSASAAVTFTSTPLDTGLPAGQTMVDTFDSPIASGYTFTGGDLEKGSISGFAAAPAYDTSEYIAVTKDGVAFLRSDKAIQSLSVYIGSADPYNYISFFNSSQYIGGFSGTQLVAGADGNQTSGVTNRLFDFTFGGQTVNAVGFGSSDYSFEFDNVAAQTVSGIPEPTTWEFMIAGIAGIGLMLRSTKKATGYQSGAILLRPSGRYSSLT